MKQEVKEEAPIDRDYDVCIARAVTVKHQLHPSLPITHYLFRGKILSILFSVFMPVK